MEAHSPGCSLPSSIGARRWRSGFWSQIFGQLVAATTVFAPAAFLLENRGASFTLTLTAILIWTVIAATIMAFQCWARALHRMPVAWASQFLVMSPVFGELLSAIVLGKLLTPSLLAGGGLIIAGAVLSNVPRTSAGTASNIRSS